MEDIMKKILKAILASLNKMLFPEPMSYEEWTKEVQAMVDKNRPVRLDSSSVQDIGQILFKKNQERQRDS